MNTMPKAVIIRECIICGRSYGVSGTTPFEIAQHRHADTIDGQTARGVCPRHKRKDAE